MPKILHTIIQISFILCTIFSVPVEAKELRVALVIGNATYETSPLANPVNDADDMAEKLRGLGFEVIKHNNIGMREIGSVLSEFRSKLKAGAVALVFYAGHGIQIKGENYFPAVDAKIETEEDVPNQSIAIRQIMDILDDSKTSLNLVFLDACRNNPYSRSFRSAANGLARVSAPTGTLISYATRPGSVAADGEGRNGLYTSKLLNQMGSREQIELSLKNVVSEVKAASLGKQEPWMEGSIEGEFCFAGCAESSAPATTPAAEIDPATIELSFWDSIKNSDNPEDFRAYLTKYPNGQFESLAHNRLERFTQAPAPRTQPPVKSAEPSPTQTATKSLTGNVGKLKAIYNLTWNQDGTIHGTYRYPKRPDTRYTLTGKDLGNGNIQLTEYTGNAISATCNLSLQGNCYVGQMNNTNGKTLKMTMCQ
jgi:hypothetical protein